MNPQFKKRSKPRVEGAQLHLLTMVVLMVVAGPMVVLNVTERPYRLRSGLPAVVKGWPFYFHADWDKKDEKAMLAKLEAWFEKNPGMAANDASCQLGELLTERGGILNLFVCTLIALPLVIGAEMFARHRDRLRKGR